MPGHILLYIGHNKKHVFVFHDMWGLHTRKFIGRGIAIVGQEVITPLDLGTKYLNVPVSLIDKASKIINLI